MCFFIIFSTKCTWCLKTSSPWSTWSLKSTASALTDSSHLTGKDTKNLQNSLIKYSHFLRNASSSSCSSSCVPSRFQTPSDSLVLKEGQSSSMQEPILASPAAAPPLSYQSDAPTWTGGDRPPHGADNSDHVRLDSVQVRTLVEDEAGLQVLMLVCVCLVHKVSWK